MFELEVATKNFHSVSGKPNNLKSILISCFCCLCVGSLWWILPHPVLVIALAILPFAAYLALHFSFPIVLGFVVFSFFRIHEVIPILSPLKLPLLLALGALYVIAFRAFIARDLNFYWCRSFTLLTLFFLLVTLGLPFAGNRGVAMNMYTSVYIKIYIMTIATSFLMQRQQDFSMASRSFIFAGLLVGGTAVYNKLMSIGLVEGSRVTIGRDIGSVLGDPNDLALVLLFPTTFALGVVLENRLSKKERLFSLIVFMTLFYAIIATQSRGGLLGILSVCGMYAFFRVKNKILLFTGASVAASILFIVAGISDRASGGAAEEGIDESAMGRLYAWGAAWGMAVHNPMTGVGLSNFYYNYYFYSSHWDGLNHAVHSTWFGVLAETGFVGFSVFITMVVGIFVSSLKTLIKYQNSDLPPFVAVAVNAMPAGLAGFIVSGTFLTQGFTWPFYLQLAIAIAAIRYVETHR